LRIARHQCYDTRMRKQHQQNHPKPSVVLMMVTFWILNLQMAKKSA
jgi:hypothetical protein